MKKLCICILVCMVVAGCTNADNSNNEDTERAEVDKSSGTENVATQAGNTDISSTKPYTFSVDGQSFEIVPVYDEILNYVADMEKDPLDNDETFEETVIQPLQGDMPEIDVGSIQIGSRDFFRSTQRFDQLKDTANQLADRQDHYNKLLEEALTTSAEHLPGDDISVYLIPLMPEARIQEVSGVTVQKRNIFLKVSPSITKESLQNIIAHEYHHTVDEENRTLLGSVLMEGKADYFANTLYPGRSMEDLSEEEEVNILKLLEDRARTSSHGWDYDALLFGNREKGIPPKAIYKIGMKIMESHLEDNPDESIKEWTEKPTEEVVKESAYSELLEKTDIVESSTD